MNLSQAEIIQVLRRRTNLNQGDFGARSFGTSYESGRTKIKNIELGKQVPTAEDLRKMARVLDVDVTELMALDIAERSSRPTENDDMIVSADVLSCFPGLQTYLDMLEKAVQIGDTELIGHIAEKAAAILSDYRKKAGSEVMAGGKP